tara:strand:+ start:8285 stop:8755 length:471 start_codon:yes stop_codon:yes gene_type:complete
MTDYWNHYKSNALEPVKNLLFRKVFRDYLNANRNAVSNFAYMFRLPQRLGRIEIRKTKKTVKVDPKTGKIINKLVPNWQATKKLWKENPEAKEKKIVLRYTNEHTDGYVFRPRYMKNTANYKNKSIYKMSVNRELRRNTEPAIVSKRIDAFLLSSK